RTGEAAVAVEQEQGVALRHRRQLRDQLGRGDAERNFTGLLSAKDLARAAQAQILLSDAKAVVGLAHQSEPRAGRFAERVAADQQAHALARTPPHAAAELVELREAETLG